ncbi:MULTISPECIES: hypothetical protein [unclassified Pseudoclavibacter]|uniref:hypothetical protein n=1 Tax=unclassified Pseudoclavibacter TaxID=2615177 RepID=UPI00130164CE|nr:MULTISPECIES: hypothetical protein [unclassified Pseudoclavibacter]KAB1644487.1 hypothetical protein F8O06_10660 [Pseudoclavibacter sp. CFCC 14310]KAB1664009.1 hypothetical protein F8O08_00860 [Pseudoclavibacter sp. CFCC 13611]
MTSEQSEHTLRRLLASTPFGIAFSGDAALSLVPGAAPGERRAVQALARRIDFAVLGAERLSGSGAPPEAPRLDPTSLAISLASDHALGVFVAQTPEHDHPYNAARRLLTADNLTGGALGVVVAHNDVLTPAPVPAAWTSELTGPRTTADFTEVLRDLWNSYPRDLLIADRQSGVFGRSEQIRAIDHSGVYSVAGPLGIPSSVQGEPVLASWAADPADDFPAAEVLVLPVRTLDDWASAARGALAVIPVLTAGDEGDVRSVLDSWAALLDAISGETHVAAVAIEVTSRLGLAATSAAGVLTALLPERPQTGARTLRERLGFAPRSRDLSDRPSPFSEEQTSTDPLSTTKTKVHE